MQAPVNLLEPRAGVVPLTLIVVLCAVGLFIVLPALVLLMIPFTSGFAELFLSVVIGIGVSLWAARDAAHTARRERNIRWARIGKLAAH